MFSSAIEQARAIASGYTDVETEAIEQEVTEESTVEESRDTSDSAVAEAPTPTVEDEPPLPTISESKVRTQHHADDSLSVHVDGATYTFRAPRGRDLSKMKKLLTPELDEVEMLAEVMAILQQAPALTADQWLDDAPLSHFQEVGKAINEHFRI